MQKFLDLRFRWPQTGRMDLSDMLWLFAATLAVSFIFEKSPRPARRFLKIFFVWLRQAISNPCKCCNNGDTCIPCLEFGSCSRCPVHACTCCGAILSQRRSVAAWNAQAQTEMDSVALLLWSQEPPEAKTFVVDQLLRKTRPTAFPALLEMPYGECAQCLKCPVHIPPPEIVVILSSGGPGRGNPYR